LETVLQHPVEHEAPLLRPQGAQEPRAEVGGELLQIAPRLPGREPQGGVVPEAAPPQLDAALESDVTLRRGAVVAPVALVVAANPIADVGKKRMVPVLERELVGNTGKLRRQVGVEGRTLQGDEAREAKGRGALLRFALMLRREIAQRDLVTR